jgi:hypothetical protein
MSMLEVNITSSQFAELQNIFNASKTAANPNQYYIAYHQKKIEFGSSVGWFGKEIREGTSPLAEYVREYTYNIASIDVAINKE